MTVAGVTVSPGQRRDLAPAASESYTGDRTTLPLAVVNGEEPGPRIFVTAAIHGDELTGTAVCRDVLAEVSPERLAGVLIVVPIVNVLGAQIHSRYLPDRRDLNRSFPGSHTGSMAARIARLVLDEVVRDSDTGVDIHTAANRRTNIPQIRLDSSDERALELGRAFGAPYILDATLRPGSLRGVTAELGVPVLTYEAGEPLKFDDAIIDVGTRGVLAVMAHLGMLGPDTSAPAADGAPTVLHESRWLRAERGGILQLHVEPGTTVEEGQEVWTTSSPLGAERATVTAPVGGIVIGATTLPLVAPGDAILHVGIPGDGSQDGPVEHEV